MSSKDPNSKQNKVKEPHLSVYPVSKPQNGKSVLLCQARGMFPDLVRFKWQAKDQSGQDVELKDDEQLEQRDENPEVQITSMLIVGEDKAKNNKFTCSVQHDISIKDKNLDIPTGNNKAMIRSNVSSKYPSLLDVNYMNNKILQLKDLCIGNNVHR